jgi:AcrR family transcriptional regulator
MEAFIQKIQVIVPEKLYLRDPMTSELGQKIISESIRIIDLYGLEKFTFKKLAEQLHTAEASIYRYFENKQRLLLYLISWYWVWKEYRLVFSIANIESPEKKLEKAIETLLEAPSIHTGYAFLDINALERIIILESSKSYLTKEVDIVNQDGLYSSYKSYCQRIATIFHEINPNYPYTHALAATVLEGLLHQQFFADHLPSLSDFKNNRDGIQTFIIGLCKKTLSK